MTTHISVFLQGFFNPSTGEMNDSLVQKRLLPKYDNVDTMCYGWQNPIQKKWHTINVTDTLAVPTWFDGKITDWIQIELRDTTTHPITRYFQTGIVTSKGVVLDKKCKAMLWPTVPFGYYFIIVHHRSSLSIMTPHVVYMQNYDNNWDFTDSLSKAFGEKAMIEVNVGKWAMWAGDITSSDQRGPENYSDHTDYNKIYNLRGIRPLGYWMEDLTGDGKIDDADLVLQGANGIRGSYVPYIDDRHYNLKLNLNSQ